MREQDDDEEEGTEIQPAESTGDSRLAGIGPAIGRYAGMTLVASIVMTIYIVGTRYELGGSEKETYIINRVNGRVEIVTGGPIMSGKYRGATYYLRPDQIKNMKRKSKSDKREMNELMREAVDRYLGIEKKSR